MQNQIPNRYKDFTLGQVVQLETTTDPIERVSIATGISMDELKKESLDDVITASEKLNTVLQIETNNFQRILTIEGKDYGLIPDWTDFTAGEYIDLEGYCADAVTNATRIMAILYREINGRIGDKYSIKEYTAKEDHTIFENVSAECYTGALLFFSRTSKNLLNILRSCLVKGMKKQTSLPQDGGGIPSFTDSQEKMYSEWMKLLDSQSELYSRTSRF